ncbi:hypothetical protein Tsubulata_005718 [Turnera subulata]|uniref:UDENN domain-containing protein n=1 Tax=Turnera subulata TaxID=218843 RepID=A0A9Q0GLT2_9ROSI|nr:hypothetical protein Tsubulata_005718 [Turnera subulata]
MDSREEFEGDRSPSPSPYVVFQSISEGAMKVAGEALQTVYAVNPHYHSPPRNAHRRSQSEFSSGNLRSNSFRRLKNQMQKVWGCSGNCRDGYFSSFNPEVLANQKRQWYQINSKTLDTTKYKEPTSLFEHFVIAGLHPYANLEAVENAYARKKKWESERDFRKLQRGPSFPSMEPQILFKYPPGKKLSLRPKDLSAFCFPEGVKTRLLERTPSLSELNELVYGQEHVGRDDSSFVFSLKVADNDTLYGVCLHVSEIVQRPPGVTGNLSPLSESLARCCRFLVSAPRCYCVLTRAPFFELHFQMLNSIVAQERLNRITQFVNEISLASHVRSTSREHDQMNGNVEYSDNENNVDWMASAIHVDDAVVLSAAAAGIISDDDATALSPRVDESRSPESVSASDASDFGQGREVDKDGKKNSHYSDDCASDSMEIRSDASEKNCGSCANGLPSPDIGSFFCSSAHKLERLGSFDTVLSPARGMISEDEDDFFANDEKDFGDDLIMEWARENKNEMLQIISAYHAQTIPQRGSELVFQPLEHLQAITYKRASVFDLDCFENIPDSFEAPEVKQKLAVAEDALALSIWTTATVCRVLSLENLLNATWFSCQVLALVTGVLLEKQMVIVCPNLGLLSATVLSIIPMIRPFQWQSLLLPIMPGTMFDFLDAPVPFIVGIQQKPADFKLKTSNLIQINVLKDQVKMCELPMLPRYRELLSQLGPLHSTLSSHHSIARRQPVHRFSEAQAEAAVQFLTIMKRYLESLCSDLRLHTITSVQSDNDRVSLLLKDSFIDSFPQKDRPFVKLLVETQLFTVLSDSRLSTFESGSP